MIVTKRCILRKLSLEDAEDLYSVLSDGEVMKYVEPPFDMQKTLGFIKAAGCVIECDPLKTASGRIAVKNGFTYDGKSGGLDVYRLTL